MVPDLIILSTLLSTRYLLNATASSIIPSLARSEATPSLPIPPGIVTTLLDELRVVVESVIPVDGASVTLSVSAEDVVAEAALSQLIGTRDGGRDGLLAER